ncbi:MAG: Do family serine endopeptidase, partial [Pseudomonadota bacterium]|nr:Do family serine endopeptidase [Pseudomonadota bacterium]
MVYRFISIAVLVLGTSVAPVAHAALPLVLPGGAGEADVALPSLADMLERTNPAVVNIATRTTVVERNRLLADPFFRRFFNIPESRRRYRRTQSAGSGVVVDADLGYIVTNNHVVDGADEISVGLSDGRTLEAELVGRDPQVDLALLKVSAENLVAIEFADSAALRVGDFVVAIGNPFGLNQTVTSGIVSALGRSGLGIEGYEDFIQTDAPINPGNSGGALVDLRGELVGINTAIYAPSGGNVGIGFAIPANMAAAIIDELVENGEVNRGYVGAVVQPLNRELAKAFDVLPADGAPAGVVIVDVQPASSAEKAGLAPGDVIVQMGDKKITSVADFENQAAVMFIGDRLDIVFVRQGQQQTLTLEIFADTQEQVAGQRITPQLSGVALQNLSAADDFGGGVLVAEINR